jgi:hypothetical protein
MQNNNNNKKKENDISYSPVTLSWRCLYLYSVQSVEPSGTKFLSN